MTAAAFSRLVVIDPYAITRYAAGKADRIVAAIRRPHREIETEATDDR